MIKELQKRPFARPLLVWVTGIFLEEQFSIHSFSPFLMLLPAGFLLSSYLVSQRRRLVWRFGYRWVGGVLFVCLFLFLSIQYTRYEIDHLEYKRPVSRLRQWAEEEQQSLLKPFERLRLSDAEKAVLATVTLGYRKTMDREVRTRFSITGVAHILAVSGFHVAIVCSFVSFLLSFLPRFGAGNWIRYLLTISLLWAFISVTGWAASSIRAGLMLTLFLTGRMLQRTVDRYNTWSASAFCMLVYKPLYLFDIGFQLSYVAVFFILYLQPRLNRLIEVRNPFLAIPWGWITVAIAAQAGTSFLCLYYFGQFSSVFLLTNLPLTLLASGLIPAALVWMLLPTWFPGTDGLKWLVEVLTRSLLWIVDSFSRFSFASFTFQFDLCALLGGYGVLFLFFSYNRSKNGTYLIAAFLLLLIILIVQLIEKGIVGKI